MREGTNRAHTLEDIFSETVIQKLYAANINNLRKLKVTPPAKLMQVAAIGPEKAYEAYKAVGIKITKEDLERIYRELEERRKFKEGVKRAGVVASDVVFKGKYDKPILEGLTKTHKTLAELQKVSTKLAFAGRPESEIPEELKEFEAVDFLKPDITRDILKNILSIEVEEDLFKNKINTIIGIFYIKYDSAKSNFIAVPKFYNNLDNSQIQEFPEIVTNNEKKLMDQIRELIDKNDPKDKEGKPLNTFYLIYKDEQTKRKLLPSEFYEVIEDYYLKDRDNIMSYSEKTWYDEGRSKDLYRGNLYVKRMVDRFDKIRAMELRFIQEGTTGISYELNSFWSEGSRVRYVKADTIKLYFGVIRGFEPEYEEKDFNLISGNLPDVSPPLNVQEFRRQRTLPLQIKRDVVGGEPVEMSTLDYSWASHVLNGKFTLWRHKGSSKVFLFKSREVPEFGCLIGGAL